MCILQLLVGSISLYYVVLEYIVFGGVYSRLDLKRFSLLWPIDVLEKKHASKYESFYLAIATETADEEEH